MLAKIVTEERVAECYVMLAVNYGQFAQEADLVILYREA